jgi:hypothetical protein
MEKKVKPVGNHEYNPLADEQVAAIWRKADKGAFGKDSETILKMAEDLITWNAERRQDLQP